MKAFFWGVLTIIIIGLIGGVIIIWSGVYNVAADVPHNPLTFWILDTARERSVEVHSQGITPPSLKDQKLVNLGFPHFHETCRLCHGAPGTPRTEFAEGLYPSPPSLGSNDVQGELSDAELFWVAKNGLKMTGMPSFGKTHTDKQIWDIIAFLRQLPEITSDDYKAMVKSEKGDSQEM